MRSVFELMFDLKYYGGFSLFEVFNLPIGLRKFYADLLVKKLEEEKNAIEKARSKKQ